MSKSTGQRKARPTRKDVALAAGVAPSTVSLVLGNRAAELGISQETQARVEAAVKELGYYPNRNILAALRGRTGNIGLYLRSDQWGTNFGYWACLRAAIESAASALDVAILVYCGRPSISTEEVFARHAGGVVDGVMVLNSANDPIASRLLETGIPAVQLGDAKGVLPYVAIDAGDGVRQATEHLAARGRKCPCYLNFHSEYKGSEDERIEAFRGHSRTVFGEAGDVIEAPWGTDALEAILTCGRPIDSVVCASDEHAYSLMKAAALRGIRVPDDLAITGFDCLPLLGTGPLMTSVQTPLEDLAKTGLDLLHELINGETEVESRILPVTLRIGDTT